MQKTKQQAEQLLAEYDWMVGKPEISAWSTVLSMYTNSARGRRQWGVYADVMMNGDVILKGIHLDHTADEICGIPVVSRSFTDEYGFHGIGRHNFCNGMSKKQAFTTFQSGLEEAFYRVTEAYERLNDNANDMRLIYRVADQSGEYRFYVEMETYDSGYDLVTLSDYLLNTDGNFSQPLVDDLRKELGWTDDKTLLQESVDRFRQAAGLSPLTLEYDDESRDTYSTLRERLPEDLRYLLDTPLTEDELDTLRGFTTDGVE